MGFGFSFWDNVDTLKSLSHGLMWAAIWFAIFAASSTGLRFYVDRRVGELSGSAQQARETAMQAQIDDAQHRLRGRHLTPEQASTISTAARESCAVLGLVHVTAANSNNEAQVYAGELARALRSAGCASEVSLPIPGLQAEVLGIHIGIKDPQNVPPGAKALARILSMTGIEFRTTETTKDFFSEVPFVLVVGARE